MSDFVLLSLALVTAAAFGFLSRLLKQPTLLGFLIAGVILGNLVPGFAPNLGLFGTFSQLGIALLLFLVGLEMDLKQLTSLTRTAFLVGGFQMLSTFLLAYLVSLIFHLPPAAAFFISLALTFSSTIIAVKLLSEKQELFTLHGKIAIGILLFQDVVAILSLMLFSHLSENSSPPQILFVLGKGALLFLSVWLVSKKPLPWLFDRLASHTDLLFVASLAWALGLAALVSHPFIGFSMEIGGFLAGLSLATSSEHFQIASRIRPVRDLFLTLFFLSLGLQIHLASLNIYLLPVILFSLLVLIIKPLSISAALGFLGYRRRTSFLTGIGLSQISEFSFILVGQAAVLGYLDNSLVSQVVLIGAFTMIVSAYLTQNSSLWYFKLRHRLKFLERQHTKESIWRPEQMPTGHTLLLGCDRTGRSLLPILKDKTRPLLVIDSNPKIVSQLLAEGVLAAYGDISDLELLEEANLDKAKLIISTVPDMADNLLILEKIKHLSPRPLTIMIAEHPREALRLYEANADFVLIPRLLTGDFLARLLSQHDARSYFEALRQRQLRSLNQFL